MQKRDEWWPTDPATGKWDLVSYGDRNDNKWWDQFTLWYMLHKEEEWSDMSVGIFEDDARWNTYTNYNAFKLQSKNPPVFMHHSRSLQKDNPNEYQHGI